MRFRENSSKYYFHSSLKNRTQLTQISDISCKMDRGILCIDNEINI